MTLTELTAKEKKLSIALRNVRHAIEDIQTETELPKLRKKYEGKHFKYDNGSSNTERWWLYVHVKKVLDGTGNFEAFHFQTTSDGRMIAQLEDSCGEYLAQKAITKKEYNVAWKKFKKAINKASS